jgi:hypothetical protein
MAPIHESDLAEKRWHDAEWKNFELWEKIEIRIKRARLLWILGTGFLFLFLASIPILMDRGPRWKALRATRMMAQLCNQTKRMSIESGKAVRLRLMEGAGLRFAFEESDKCDAPSESWILRGEGRVLKGDRESAFLSVLSPAQGQELGVPGLTLSFCYDSLVGAAAQTQPGALEGIAVIPVADLEEKRSDRVAVLLVSESVGELTFE